MKNKKGDIPITILVIGIISLCALTIFSFWFSNNKVDSTFVGPGLVETIYSVQEEINYDGSFSEIKGQKGKVDLEIVGNKIIAEYFLKDKSLIKIGYVPK